jgi:CDGSH-type Zn-finger protein
MVDKDMNPLEEELEPEIVIMQDPEKRASSGIYVKGPITIEAADGTEYEVRNRVMLCRCGQSANKPFCNANHVPARFNDGHLKR